MNIKPTTGQNLKICLQGIGITAIAFFLFQYIGFLNNTDNLLYDKFIIHSDSKRPDNRLLIIEQDDESVSKLYNSLPRSDYVKLIRKLLSVGAKTVAFDIFFIDKKNPDIDSQLASATDSLKHIIHCFYLDDELPDPNLFKDKSYEKYTIQVNDETGLNVISAENAYFPDKQFISKFNKAGCITAEWDSDGRFRRLPLFFEFNNLVYPTLGIAAIFDYFGINDKIVEIENSFWGRNVVIDTPSETFKIPINSKGQALLNFYGTFNVLESVPLHKALSLLDAYQPKDSLKVPLPLFDKKIVLIGSTETGDDIFTTPFSASFPGVGLHTTLISNILNGDLITEAPKKINAIISLILSLLLLGFFIYYQKYSKSIWIFCAITFFVFVMFNIVGYFLFFDYFNIWLKLIQIDSTFIILFVSLLFYEKVIRLKELNSKIDQLEDDIFIKKTDLNRLDQVINSQTEQYKVIQFLASELQTVLKTPSIIKQEHLENFFPKFFEHQDIIKSKLEDEIELLKKEKDKIFKDKENLEHEKNIYENIINSNVIQEQKPIPEKPTIDKVQLAREIMKGWQHFQLKQKKSSSTPNSIFGIVAVPTILNEKGKTVATEMGEIFESIKKISSYNSSVLITGEHGTGKQLIANALHKQSNRSHRELVNLNCAAIPEHLLESELFGHVRGAFTGAHTDRKGKFEYANGGTIFLDEIGDLKLDLQAKLLRVLQDKEFQRVGSNETIQVDVRVITATNKNLKQCIENNEFRSDLYFRLNVVNLHVPPLRERIRDIPFLIQHFLNEFNTQYDKEKFFSREAIVAAMCYEWPGNIRMLQHFVEQVCIMTSGDTIDLSALPEEVQSAYCNIFESNEVPWWNQIEEIVRHEKERLLAACQTAIKENKVNQFSKSNNLQANHEILPNCYEYFRVFVDGMASIFSTDKRKELVQSMLVQMQNQLLQWCQEEGIKKGEVIDKIERLLGRSRRQIDNWRKA